MPCTVILTALPVEYSAIRSYLTDLQDEETPEGVVYERGKFASNGKVWEIGIAEVGVGNVKAAIKTQLAITYFNPDILFFVGIAGGIKDVKIGDVVVAEDVFYYESGKVTEPDVFQSRPKAGKSNFALVERAKNVARKENWLERLSSSPALEPSVKVAPIVAGEIVVASKESGVFNLIKANYNDAIAVEMEGYGFLSAAFAYPQIKSIVIRGISDLVAGKNDDSVESEEKRQAKASHHACAFALELLTKFDPEAGARDPIIEDRAKGTENASASASGQGAISNAGPILNSTINTGTINNFFGGDTSLLAPDPNPRSNLNFLGREEAIEDIKKIADQPKQIIVIYADSGVGKTTLAENFFELDKSYKQLLKVDDISTDGTTTAEEVLNRLLKQLGVDALTRSSEFQGNLNLLEEKLIERGSKTGLFIDNIEPLLDKNGIFVDNKYEDLFLKISCLPVKFLILFTSCISLKFENKNLSNRVENYPLNNLKLDSWQYFFRERKIFFEDEILTDVYEKCCGNAKAMGVLRGITKKDYDNNINIFWTRIRGITNLKELIEKYLNDLQNININAYKLLCYLACYKIAKIPNHHVHRLADDVSGLQNSQLEIDLKDRCILEVKTDTYYLHTLFRREVYDPLKLNLQDLESWKEINRKVADLYNEDSKDISKDKSYRIDAAFEAFDYYHIAQEFEECHKILLQILEADKDIANLRCSENLWRYMSQIVDRCEKLREKTEFDGLSNLSRAMILIPLGILYSEVGKTINAVDVSKEIITAIQGIDSSVERKNFAEMSSYLISARSHRMIGNLELALEASKKAIDTVKTCYLNRTISAIDNYSWSSLSVYEKGNVHLEKAKLNETGIDRYKDASIASRCYVEAAFLTLREKTIPYEVYILIIKSIKPKNIAKNLNKIREFISRKRNSAKQTNKSTNNDYTKYFRLLFNFSQCLRLMNFNRIGNLFLIMAENQLPKTTKPDDLNSAWVYLERASNLSLHENTRENYKKEIDTYQNLLNLQKRGNLQALCSTSFSYSYGNFMLKSGNRIEAMKIFLELEKTLDSDVICFDSLKCNNYYSICQTWLELEQSQRETYLPTQTQTHLPQLSNPDIFHYLTECRSIQKELKLYFYKSKIDKLYNEMCEKLPDRTKS